MKNLGVGLVLIIAIGLSGFSISHKKDVIKSENESISLASDGEIGVITYSFRSMPDQSAEATLKYILESGISTVELMGGPAEAFAGKPESKVDDTGYRDLRREKQEGTLNEEGKIKLNVIEKGIKGYNKQVAEWRATVSMDKFKELRKMYNDAGVTIYAFKPNALREHHTDEEIGWAMRAAKALGASHVTVELPSNPAQSQRLGDLGEKHDMHIGYHGHTQQTPTWWDTALEQSKYNWINIDLGHYIAAGNTDAIEFIKKNHERILSMHIKDRHNPANGKENKLWGKGDTPIVEVLNLMKENKYKFPATVEMEYTVRDGKTAVDEVRTCVDYCKEALK
jgi:sugar phosphate isomerase/epimerase